MVKINDAILVGGLLLGVLYFSKRSDQISVISPDPSYYEQVQKIDLTRISEFSNRIEQLKDIRSQILDFEKGQTEQKVSFLQSEIGKAQQAGSAAQSVIARLSMAAPKLGYGPTFVTQKTAQYIREAGGNLQSAFERLISIGDYSRAQVISNLAEKQANREILSATQQFITQAEAQQAELRSAYAELEQIV